MTPYINELAYGNEVKGLVCPECGGSVVRNKGKLFCYEDGFVVAVKECTAPYPSLGEEELRWLDTHSKELEPEID